MINRKNILAENMLRFRSKNIAAQEEAAIRRIIEQVTPDADIANLGEQLNALNLKDGVYELKGELADVNIFIQSDQDEKTISSKMPAFSGAYARPLYVSKNKTMFFIGKPMTGGPLAENKPWSVEPLYKIAEPRISSVSGNVLVRRGYREEVLNTNSAAAAYMQIYNFNTEGYRDNAQITKLVQLLESKGIIPNLKDEIPDTAYNLFTKNRHDGAIRIIKTA
jgi:hypothetical protein